MKTKKLLALLMAGAMSVSMLSGCGGSAAKTDDSSADAAHEWLAPGPSSS